MANAERLRCASGERDPDELTAAEKLPTDGGNGTAIDGCICSRDGTHGEARVGLAPRALEYAEDRQLVTEPHGIRLP